MRRLLLIALIALGLYAGSAHARSGDTWILIDTVALRLDVYRGSDLIERIRNIAIGSGGASALRRRGEEATPLGEFRINRVNRESRFHIFLGLDYPTIADADRALKAGWFDSADYHAFFDSMLRSGASPQETVLGGNIGIHGLGEADPDIHGRVNWTNGCIALTNQEIERLARLVDIGTRVFIR